MPNCSICGQPIDKLPHWLDEVEINFRCAVCAENTAQAVIDAAAADFAVEDAPAPAFEEEEEEVEEEEAEE